MLLEYFHWTGRRSCPNGGDDQWGDKSLSGFLGLSDFKPGKLCHPIDQLIITRIPYPVIKFKSYLQ